MLRSGAPVSGLPKREEAGRWQTIVRPRFRSTDLFSRKRCIEKPICTHKKAAADTDGIFYLRSPVSGSLALRARFLRGFLL